MKAETISLTDVRKSFGSLVAVGGVDMAVHEGEIFGLLGPNGAGKTTLIRMIMDIIRPDSGAVKIFGRQLKEEDKKHIGYLPEERGLYSRQKVFSILEYFGQLKGGKKREVQRRIEELLERFGMTEVRDKKVRELSKGNQQKIQLIAALVADPEIVVLDEPLSGLDPVNARMVTSLICELASTGKTILLSTHQMGLVETLCQRVLLINKGQTVFYGGLEEIQKQYSDNAVLAQSTADYANCRLVVRHTPLNGSAKMKVYLQEGVQPRDLLTWLMETGAAIASFEQAITPLEDIFIRAVEEKR